MRVRNSVAVISRHHKFVVTDRGCLSALKGRHRKAQGNALGTPRNPGNPALKGGKSPRSSEGNRICFALSGREDLRALPWIETQGVALGFPVPPFQGGESGSYSRPVPRTFG